MCFSFRLNSRRIPTLFSAVNIEALEERLKEAARRNRFTYASYGRIGDFSLPVLERQQADNAPSIYISAGVHGDEPAGPMAVLELLRRRSLPETMNFMVFPIVNPTGLVAGTRENADGIDLNRDYGPEPVAKETLQQLDWIGQRPFDLILCLHEDSDGEGFYIYSHEKALSGRDYAGLALKAAEPFTGIDPREEIDEMPAREGRMFPPEEKIQQLRSNQPESLRLYFENGARCTFTTETPSRFPIEKRIKAQCAVVEVILQTFAAEWPLAPQREA